MNFSIPKINISSNLTILEHLSSGVALLDENGRICYSNSVARKCLSSSAHRLEGTKISEYFFDHSEEIEAVITGILAKTSFENKIDEKYLSVDIYFHPCREQQISALVEIRDTSEMHVLECIKADFVANLLHKFRTPITSLSNVIYLLRSKLKDNEEAGLLQMGLQEINRFQLLLENVRDIFLLESGLMTDTMVLMEWDVAQIVEELLKEVSPMCRENDIKLKSRIGEDMIMAMVDRKKLLKVLRNILLNAISYSDGDGIITVIATEDPENVRISVIDSGKGIAADIKDTIFNKYSHGSNSYLSLATGYGLGLYISNELVKLMNGQITVYSHYEKGAQFDISFPK